MTDQFELTEDQLAIQEAARKFTADRITPFAAEWDEKHIFPRDTIKEAADLGFAAIYVSEESGGIGLGRLEAALIMEAMAYGCPSTSAFISIHNMAAWMIDSFGSDELKARYLPDLVTMDKIASYCLTEPGSGSDAAALEADGSAWSAKELKTLSTKSPQTCKVALRQLKEGAQMPDFAAEMRQEYAIGARVVQMHDFIEGVRALIIEKDNAPRWNPDTAEGVTDALLDTIFAPLPEDQAWTPLEIAR